MSATYDTESVFEALWAARGSSRGHISFDTRGDTVTLIGLQTGKVTAVSIKRNEALGGHVVVLHVAGSSYFIGRGMQGYAGAEYQTILVEDRPWTPRSAQTSFRYVQLSAPFEAKSSDVIRTTQTSLVIQRLQKEVQS